MRIVSTTKGIDRKTPRKWNEINFDGTHTRTFFGLKEIHISFVHISRITQLNFGFALLLFVVFWIFRRCWNRMSNAVLYGKGISRTHIVKCRTEEEEERKKRAAKTPEKVMATSPKYKLFVINIFDKSKSVHQTRRITHHTFLIRCFFSLQLLLSAVCFSGKFDSNCCVFSP